MAVKNQITFFSASSLTSTEYSPPPSGRKAAKIKMPATLTKAATNPLPPSNTPKAFPCEDSPPSSRVVLMSDDQKSKMVVIPQNPYNQNIAPAAGINDKLIPPKPVSTSAKVINALGE